MGRTHRATLILALGARLLSAGSPAWGFDLEATDVEVNQSVQNLSNSVILIEGKKTTVRLHVRVAEGIDLVRVRGRLEGTRGGSPLGTLLPAPPTAIARTSPDRAEKGQSFQFELPRSWTTGTVQLTATVDPDNDYGESNEGNNSVSATVTFTPGEPLILRQSLIVVPGGNLPSALDNFSFYAWMISAYPITTLSLQSVQRVDFPVDVTNDRCNCPRDAQDRCTSASDCANDSTRACSIDSDCGCGRVNEALVTGALLETMLETNASALLRTRFYGMVDDGTGFMRGCSAGIPGFASSGPTGSNSFGWDTDGTYGDWYGGHEVAHSIGRVHSRCCNAGGGIMSPYPNCQISPADNSIFGLDTSVEKVYPPTSADHMSYCNNQWVSDFNYTGLDSDLATAAALGDLLAGTPILRAFFFGRGNTDLGIASLGPAYLVSSALPAIQRPPGNWELRFLDGQGQTLGSHSFDPYFEVFDKNLSPSGPVVGEPHQMVTIAELVDAVPGTAEVQLFESGNFRDNFFVSANAPLVTLTFPNGGENLSGSVNVNWQAFDQDGGTLLTTVLYSRDGGNSWIALATNVSGSSTAVSLEGVPGSTDGLFGVLVTDGYNTAFDTSDSKVTVANNAPNAFILSPEDGREYASGGLVILEAFAQDPEDGMMADAQLSWSSDREGALGTGVVLETSSLTALGTHVIRLEALDNDGAATIDSILVEVTADPAVPSVSGVGLALLAASLLATGAVGRHALIRGRRRRSRG